MSYVVFLHSLLEKGKVLAPRDETVSPSDQEEGDAFLQSFEALYRQTLPGEPPALDLVAARWAAMMIFHACRFVIYRDAEPEAMAKTLTLPEPKKTPAAHYSVDLTMRFLPDVARFAKKAAKEDPLHVHIQRWACAWPLSSVGMSNVTDIDIAALMQSPSLRLLYVDRILARQDRSRLEDPQVKEAIRGAVGMYPNLAGNLASLLKDEKESVAETET